MHLLVACMLSSLPLPPLLHETGKDPWKIMRGTWFEVSGDKWYPLEEQESMRIEMEHCRMSWRNRVSEGWPSIHSLGAFFLYAVDI